MVLWGSKGELCIQLRVRWDKEREHGERKKFELASRFRIKKCQGIIEKV
jgi:hypothetical protein